MCAGGPVGEHDRSRDHPHDQPGGLRLGVGVVLGDTDQAERHPQLGPVAGGQPAAPQVAILSDQGGRLQYVVELEHADVAGVFEQQALRWQTQGSSPVQATCSTGM
jgi:hypothetical protein